MMKKFHYQAHKTCPCCKLPGVVEDTAHLLICPDVRIFTAWTTKTAELKEWVSDMAGPYIQEAIRALIRRTDRYPQDYQQDYQQWPGEVQQAYHDQQELGWSNLLKGRIAIT